MLFILETADENLTSIRSGDENEQKKTLSNVRRVQGGWLSGFSRKSQTSLFRIKLLGLILSDPSDV